MKEIKEPSKNQIYYRKNKDKVDNFLMTKTLILIPSRTLKAIQLIKRYSKIK